MAKRLAPSKGDTTDRGMVRSVKALAKRLDLTPSQERAQLARMRRDRREQAKGEPPREGWITVGAPNLFGDLAPVQVPQALMFRLLGPAMWRPGASLGASATFTAQELGEAAKREAPLADRDRLALLARVSDFVARTVRDHERGAVLPAIDAALGELGRTLQRAADATPAQPSPDEVPGMARVAIREGPTGKLEELHVAIVEGPHRAGPPVGRADARTREAALLATCERAAKDFEQTRGATNFVERARIVAASIRALVVRQFARPKVPPDVAESQRSAFVADVEALLERPGPIRADALAVAALRRFAGYSLKSAHNVLRAA